MFSGCCCSFNSTSYVCFVFQPQDNFNFGDVTEFADTEPNYWIGKWFLEYVDGFVYQISDKSVGMLFNDGLKFMQTPGREYVTFAGSLK